MTPAATQRRPDRDRFAAGGTNHMTDFDYGLAGRRTAWPVASPAEMFWPDILSPVSHLEGDREFADSALEGDGFELPVREHRAMAPSHGFAAASHREAALCE